jgi:hypothetical protein
VTLQEENKVTINPLLPEGRWDYFLLDGLPIKNHEMAVMYDATGERYKKGRGLMIFINGAMVKKTELAGPVDLVLNF